MAQEIYKLIVCASDGSEESTNAARHAISLAKMSGAKLRVIYVANLNLDVKEFRIVNITDMVLDDLKKEGEMVVNEIINIAKEAGVEDVQGDILRGSPKKAIVEWSKEQDADLIVVGWRGHSRIYYAIGSVAEYVVRNAHCPVLIVR